jgi:mycothiol synthase
VIELRVADSDADLELWAAIKTAVVPDGAVTGAQLRQLGEPERLLLLAELDGVPAACGIGTRSGFGGRAFLAARVLPEFRRRGVGTELMRALTEHGRGLGLDGMNTFVAADDRPSIAFAERFGLIEVDYQLEQKRDVGDEAAPVIPPGLEVESLEHRREEILREVWPVAREGYADLPLPGEVTYRIESWLREEATRPSGSFVAREFGEVVAYAGMLERDETTAEHGLTVVRRDRRGCGIARALKETQIHWAAENGVRQLVTWTQEGNEAMQALNHSLGYVDTSKTLTFQGPLP